jgi:hypothetical protein
VLAAEHIRGAATFLLFGMYAILPWQEMRLLVSV